MKISNKIVEYLLSLEYMQKITDKIAIAYESKSHY